MFYDSERGLYCDGLTEASPVTAWIPENPEKKYYTRYANTLAVLFGLCGREKEQEILEPGFKKIRLNPNLYGLAWAEIKVPTPYGVIECSLKEGAAPEINIPEEIEVWEEEYVIE